MLDFHPVFVCCCCQWWSWPLIWPLLSDHGLPELGGGASYQRHKWHILHQRLQAAGAAERSVCMPVHLTLSVHSDISFTLYQCSGSEVSHIFIFKFAAVHSCPCPAHLAIGSWKCPSSAASCLKVGDEYMNLGQVSSGPTWDGNVLKLQYTNGQACPDGNRNKSSIIRFKCDKDQVVRDDLLK